MHYRMLVRMKVTSILPDDLVLDVRRYSKGKNITDSLLIALREWLALRRVKELNKNVRANPLEFDPSYTAEDVRGVNRRP